MSTSINELQGIQPELKRVLTSFGSVGIPTGTPVNGVNSTYTITAAEFATLDNGDTVTVAGNVFTKAGAPGAAAFTNIAELTALINALPTFTATAPGGTAVKVDWYLCTPVADGQAVVLNSVAATTALFAAGVTASTAKILKADLDELKVGDTVAFDGELFTKVTAAPGADEFTNVAELIALFDALADWVGAADGNNIDVTYKNNTDDKDGIDIVMTYNRATAGGVTGTESVIGGVAMDGTNLYLCPAGADVNDTANWRKIAHGGL